MGIGAVRFVEIFRILITHLNFGAGADIFENVPEALVVEIQSQKSTFCVKFDNFGPMECTTICAFCGHGQLYAGL